VFFEWEDVRRSAEPAAIAEPEFAFHIVPALKNTGQPHATGPDPQRTPSGAGRKRGESHEIIQ
jgi:hypothetical protein